MVKKVINGIEYEWSDTAIDYSFGIDFGLRVGDNQYIYFEEEDVPNLPPEIRSNILNIPRKIGCWVLTPESCKKILNNRG